MVFWGLILTAIGVEALFDVGIWPLVLIAGGGALLLSAFADKRGGYPGWYYRWFCCYDPYLRRELVDRRHLEGEEIERSTQ